MEKIDFFFFFNKYIGKLRCDHTLNFTRIGQSLMVGIPYQTKRKKKKKRKRRRLWDNYIFSE